MSAFRKELMYGHLMGVYTGKGWNTDYGRSILEKASMSYPNSTTIADTDNLLATQVSTAIEEEVKLEYRLAQIFREITMNAKSMVMPLQSDTGLAVFNTGGESALGVGDTTGLALRGGSAGDYAAKQKILQAFRLISTTFMDNHVDEEVLVNLMPMLTQGVARAHARAVDNMIINGEGSDITGLLGFATAADKTVDIDQSALAATSVSSLTAEALLTARKKMGKYGLNPADVTYVVSQKRYYDLIADPAFADITDVGSDIATKVVGAIGAVYGSPVIISDNFGSESSGEAVAIAVATSNYVIPRLRGVTVEQDYEVARQRNLIVAHQSLGFDEIFADDADNRSAVRINLVD